MSLFGKSKDARKLASFDIQTRDDIDQYQCNNPMHWRPMIKAENSNKKDLVSAPLKIYDKSWKFQLEWSSWCSTEDKC